MNNNKIVEGKFPRSKKKKPVLLTKLISQLNIYVNNASLQYIR